MTVTTRSRNRIGVGVFVAAMIWGATFAHAQKATERFIPIGQSPGVSGRSTSLGTITAVDARAKTITIADSAGPKTVRLTDTTHIWLDRSKLKRSNLTGRFSDLVRGRRVEAKYQLPATGHLAEWVKVEITGP